MTLTFIFYIYTVELFINIYQYYLILALGVTVLQYRNMYLSFALQILRLNISLARFFN